MKAHKREVPRCLERTNAARRKEENLCLHEDIISSRIRALITAKKKRKKSRLIRRSRMLLKTNKYRKDKKADCRQNELGSRIFMGRVFGDYAECLHFYPSFSYGRIIAGERHWRFSRQCLFTAARSASCRKDLRVLEIDAFFETSGTV